MTERTTTVVYIIPRRQFIVQPICALIASIVLGLMTVPIVGFAFFIGAIVSNITSVQARLKAPSK